MSERPLDVLEASLEETVTVHLKDGTVFHGTLSGYDQHMNVVLEADRTTAADRGDESAVSGELNAETVEDTTIIRGDNVVSIRS